MTQNDINSVIAILVWLSLCGAVVYFSGALKRSIQNRDDFDLLKRSIVAERVIQMSADDDSMEEDNQNIQVAYAKYKEHLNHEYDYLMQTQGAEQANDRYCMKDENLFNATFTRKTSIIRVTTICDHEDHHKPVVSVLLCLDVERGNLEVISIYDENHPAMARHKEWFAEKLKQQPD